MQQADASARCMMKRDSLHFLFLNIGHFLDHLFMLIFATAAALALAREWNLSYGELIGYATPGFFAFGLCSYPAGWLADRWSRQGMMCVFFIGIGCASIATGFSRTPLQIGVGLFVIGVWRRSITRSAWRWSLSDGKTPGCALPSTVFGAILEFACAALLTGYLIDNSGWRAAFVVPGAISILIGLCYAALCWTDHDKKEPLGATVATSTTGSSSLRGSLLLRISLIVFFTTAISSIVFQATTFALPKIFDERLQGIVAKSAQLLGSLGVPGRIDLASMVGAFAFVVFVIASFAQLIVGSLLDRVGPRQVFIGAAAIQVVFFGLMAGLHDGWALAVALDLCLAPLAKIPINDYMIGKLAAGPARARVYGVRYVVSFTALAASLPLIAFVYEQWGFDMLFRMLCGVTLLILIAVACLPRRMPTLTA